ncbi:MAG: hypothetical protein MJ240_10560 [Kiritimatiellae bacterium]|nr:hypothetical protein [Kiritimatiellia bacterium]
MIRKVISKFGLAAHLGLLAAFPVVFAPYLSSETLGQATLWMSLFAFLWIWAEPSVRAGEHSCDSRCRVLMSIVKDPVFYFCLLLVAYALVRWWNSGIAVWYDSEQSKWLVREPTATVMPASAGNSGFLPLAAAVALSVFLVGARHALGLQARVFCGLTATFLVGVGGLISAVLACLGKNAYLASSATAGLADVPLLGTAFGLFLLLSVVFGMDAEGRKWSAARLPFVVAVGGSSAGLVLFSPPLIAALHLLVVLLFLVFSTVYCARVGSMGSVARGIGLVVLGLSVPALLLMGLASPELQQVKLQGLDVELAFPLEYKSLHQVLSRIAKEMWMERPWLGVGVGAYGLHAPFLAVKADWAVIPPHPQFALSGYWTLLAERGIIGCALLFLCVALLLWSWGRRLWEAFRYLHHNDDADVFLFACPPVVWTAPFVCVLVALELLISPLFNSIASVFAFVVSLALSAASFPRDPKASTPEPSQTSLNQGK